MELERNTTESRAATIKLEVQTMSAKRLKLAATSSFQTQSGPLLHILASAEVPIDIVFVDTGFHFPETWAFVHQLKELLGFKLVTVSAQRPFSSHSGENGSSPIPPFSLDPRRCCTVNKVEPVRQLMANYDVWISGVRTDQTKTRANMSRTEEQHGSATRFHPMLDWTQRDIYRYRLAHELPEHPLEAQGFLSIGCMPCTRPFLADLDARDSRWLGLNKKECGLHTDLRAGNKGET